MCRGRHFFDSISVVQLLLPAADGGQLAIADAQHWVALVHLAVREPGRELSVVRGSSFSADEATKAEVARHSAELKSSLLASLGHDWKTPLTALTVAANNLNASWLTNEQRLEQADVVRTELVRLNRLFQNLIDITRIESHAVTAEREWVAPADIIEAATQQNRLGARSASARRGQRQRVVARKSRSTPDLRGARARAGERGPTLRAQDLPSP